MRRAGGVRRACGKREVSNNSNPTRKMAPAGALTTLHSFCSQANCTDDGGTPPSLIQASNGNIYGVAIIGGASDTGCIGYGCGTVFEVTPGGNLTTIYNFCTKTGCLDGSSPSGLAQAIDGNFYEPRPT